MSNRIKAKVAKKKKVVNVYDLFPPAYYTWDSKLKASWCVNNALWMQREGLELDAPGISVEFDGEDTIVVTYEVPDEVQS